MHFSRHFSLALLGFVCLISAPIYAENCEVFLVRELEFDEQTKAVVQDATQKAITSGHLRVSHSPEANLSLEVQSWGKQINLPSDLSLEKYPGLALQALVGLSEHPFNSAARPGQIENHKADYLLALKAFLEQSQSQNKGLLVAPPGFGKSLLAHDFLAARLSLGGLHVVVADYRLAVSELKKTLNNLPIRTLDTQDVLRSLREGKSPEGLWLTTTAALRSLYSSTQGDRRSAFRKSITTLIYDEAHHLGAPHMKSLVEDLDTDMAFKGYILGLTATPFHQDIDLQAVFANQTYWAYLDQEPKWGVRRNAFEVIDQIYQAIARGELTPFNRMFFLTGDSLQTELPLFIQNKSEDPSESNDIRFVINPELYPAAFAYLKPLVELRKKTLLIANTIEEANRLSSFLKSNYDLPVFMVHSESETAITESMAYFKKTPRGLMIAVRMMDEAVNVPDLDLIIDLNSSSSIRQFAQRLGRGLRLETGKFDVDFVCFNEINQQTSKDLIELIDHLRRNRSPRISTSTADQAQRAILQSSSTSILNISNEQAWSALETTVKNFWSKSAPWRPFLEAQKWARDNNIKSLSQYRAANRPADIPKSPESAYPNEWTSWGDFLGTENVHKKNFRPYAEAKKWAIENNIRDFKDYRAAERPSDIPSHPNMVYKDDWKSWGDFLDTGHVSTQKRIYRSYKEAQKWAQENKISGEVAYRTTPKPPDLPAIPYKTYETEWTSWNDFLGTKIVYRSYAEAQRWAQENGFKNGEQFKAAQKPADIPATPQKVYRDQWNGWESFLGTKRTYRSYEEAQKWAQENGIRTNHQYAATPKPSDIPSAPYRLYKDRWTSWNDFLGTEKHRR